MLCEQSRVPTETGSDIQNRIVGRQVLCKRTREIGFVDAFVENTKEQSVFDRLEMTPISRLDRRTFLGNALSHSTTDHRLDRSWDHLPCQIAERDLEPSLRFFVRYVAHVQFSN